MCCFVAVAAALVLCSSERHDNTKPRNSQPHCDTKQKRNNRIANRYRNPIGFKCLQNDASAKGACRSRNYLAACCCFIFIVLFLLLLQLRIYSPRSENKRVAIVARCAAKLIGYESGLAFSWTFFVFCLRAQRASAELLPLCLCSAATAVASLPLLLIAPWAVVRVAHVMGNFGVQVWIYCVLLFFCDIFCTCVRHAQSRSVRTMSVCVRALSTHTSSMCAAIR